MNSEIFNYLSEGEKKQIAERVFESELRAHFQKQISEQTPAIYDDFSTVYNRVLSKYIKEMNLIHMDFVPTMKKIIEIELKKLENTDTDVIDDNTIVSNIIWRLQVLSEEVINENKEELKPIIRDKVFRCCNETLLIEFVSMIVKRMNLDKAMQKLIDDMEGNKT